MSSAADASAADRKADSLRELHPYVAVVAKKLRAARKKLLKLEEYDKKLQEPKAKLLPEQVEALKAKPKLEILVHEYEDILQLFEEIPNEPSSQAASVNATPVKATEQLQEQRLSDCSQLLKFFCVSDYLSPHVIIPEEMHAGILVGNPETKLPSVEEFKQQLSNIAQLRDSFRYMGTHISLAEATQSIEKYLSLSAEALNEHATYEQVVGQVQALAKITEDYISATTLRMAMVAADAAASAAAAAAAPVAEVSQDTSADEVAIEESQAEPVPEVADQVVAPVDTEAAVKSETTVEVAAPAKKSSNKNTRSNTRTRHSEPTKTKKTAEETVTRTQVIEGSQGSRTIITTKVIETVVIRSQPTGYAAALRRGMGGAAPVATSVATPAAAPVDAPVDAPVETPTETVETPADAPTVAETESTKAPAEAEATAPSTEAKPSRSSRSGDGGDRRRGGQPRRDGQGSQPRRDGQSGQPRRDGQGGQPRRRYGNQQDSERSRNKESDEGWKTV